MEASDRTHAYVGPIGACSGGYSRRLIRLEVDRV
jgi:hypothetical protein